VKVPAISYTDACEVLAVARGAPVDVAEAAYRALAKRTHPDHDGDGRAMVRLNTAVTAIREAGPRPSWTEPTCRLRDAVPNRLLPWGKHRGTAFSAVPLSYLLWLATESKAEPTFRHEALRALHVRVAQEEARAEGGP
jgi:uncharacterized protein (DUF3820 family)